MTAPAVGADLTRLRAMEFSRLDQHGHAYLDYTGSGLYADCQIRQHGELLRSRVFGNPHSVNPTSQMAAELVDDARTSVLNFFDADPDEYVVIFTPNATGALRIVGEAYPFGRGSSLVLTSDNHNSVNGLREYASSGGAQVRYLPLDTDLRLPAAWWEHVPPAAGPSLFAYPAQSNFSGVRHGWQPIEVMQQTGYDVAIDAAAFAPTNPLTLRGFHPDFVCLSFYKMFGYPTGLGALLARRQALARLRRPWFSGGTVEWASVQNVRHRFEGGPAAFEDGTVDFLGISAVPIGLSFLAGVGMDRIQQHVATMTRRLLDGLTALRHANGQPMVRLYGPRDSVGRGGTVAFNLLGVGGDVRPFADIERAAARVSISIRGGCFCNPGASEWAFGFDAARAAACLDRTEPGQFDEREFASCLGSDAVGAVRASVGLPTVAADVDRLVEFVARGG